MGVRDEIRRFHAVIGGRTLPLGFGCATIGRQADEAIQREIQATLEQAYTHGFRFFDTSAQYGGSEFRVGAFLRHVERSSVFLATKSPVPVALSPGEAALYVRQGLHNSLERLGLSTIDLFQIHDVETLDQVLAPGGVLETLIAAREAGLIRYFGLATRFHDLLTIAAAHGAFDTILTYLDYTLLDQSAVPLIAQAARHNLGVLNGSPLSFGLLTGPDPRHNASISAEFRRQRHRASQLYDFCAKRSLSLLALALHYPLQNPDISITLTGPGSPVELQATLAACQSEITAHVWQELRSVFGILPPPDAV